MKLHAHHSFSIGLEGDERFKVEYRKHRGDDGAILCDDVSLFVGRREALTPDTYVSLSGYFYKTDGTLAALRKSNIHKPLKDLPVNIQQQLMFLSEE